MPTELCSAAVRALTCLLAVVATSCAGGSDPDTGHGAAAAGGPPKNERPTYNVTFVDDGDVLNVRDDPDPGARIVEVLEPGEKGIELTGGSGTAPGGRWVEIITPTGSRGWVNRAYLTEDVSDFCENEDAEAAAEAFAAMVRLGPAGDDGTSQDLERGVVATVSGDVWIGTLRPLPLGEAPLTEDERMSGPDRELGETLWSALRSNPDLFSAGRTCNEIAASYGPISTSDRMGDGNYWAYGTREPDTSSGTTWYLWLDQHEETGEWDVVGLTLMRPSL